MSGRAFGFTLSYRPVAPELVGNEPDQRPVSQLPRFSCPTQESAEARDRQLIVEVGKLVAQGYQVEAVERWNQCQRCQGAGQVPVRPKGWRKKTPPPLFMMGRVSCPSCGGNGAEHVEEAA